MLLNSKRWDWMAPIRLMNSGCARTATSNQRDQIENDVLRPSAVLGRVTWRYTPRIRQCVGRSRLSACAQVLSPPFSPILLGFALHGRRIHVLHFEPIGRAAGAVGRILPLRHDTFKPHLAGMGKDGRAVALDMLVQAQAGSPSPAREASWFRAKACPSFKSAGRRRGLRHGEGLRRHEPAT